MGHGQSQNQELGPSELLSLTLSKRDSFCSPLLSSLPSTSHIYPQGQDSIQGRNEFSWNCGSLFSLTEHKTILEYFRSRIISLPQVMFLLLACPSKMKGANIKALGAAFY